MRVERNPKVTEVCDWKFPFVIEFKAKTYIFYAESLSVHDLWCKAFIAILIPRYSHPQVMNPVKPETDYPQNSPASQGPRGFESEYPTHPNDIPAGDRRHQPRLNSPSKGGMRRDERNKFPSYPDDVEYYEKERQHESPVRARQNSIDADSRDFTRDKAEFRTQQPRMMDPRDLSEYPRNYPDEAYSGRAGYQEPIRQGYQDARQYQGYQEPPRQGYQEHPRQGYQDSPTSHNQSPTRSTYQNSSHSRQESPIRAHQGSPSRNPPEVRQYHEPARAQYPEANRRSYKELPREPLRQSYEEHPRGNYDAPNPRMAYAENARPNLPPAPPSQYEDPKLRKSNHSRQLSRESEQTVAREVNTYSNKPRDNREPFETDIPSIPKSRHTQPADEETVLTKFNFPIKEDVKNIKRERLTRPGQDRGHDARDAKQSVQSSSTRSDMPAPQNPLAKTSMGFNEVDLRESLNKGPAGMLDILEDMDGLGLPDKVDNWKGRGRGTMNMSIQGFNVKPQGNYKEPVNLGGSQRIPRENFEGRGADYSREAYNEPVRNPSTYREAYNEPVRNPSPYRERNMPYREQPPPYQEQPQYSRTYSDVRDSPPYTDQSSYSRGSTIRESQQYVEQPVYREKQTGYREQPQYYEEEPHARRQVSNSSYKEHPYREAPRVPSKYSETPVYNQSENSKPPPRAPSKYSEAPVYIQPEPSVYKSQESMYRKSSWNEEPQNQSLKAPSTVATGAGDPDWDNWDD